MKDFLFDIMKEIIGDQYPSHIGEIGTHRGKTAEQFIKYYAPKVKKLRYDGYDVFDIAFNDKEYFHKVERNGKGAAGIDGVEEIMFKLTMNYKNFSYKLHKGYTTQTLVSPMKFDFVYIDGGHSYETVKHDYSMVKESKIIVFDDYHLQGVKQFVDELAETVDVEIIKTPNKHIWPVVRN